MSRKSVKRHVGPALFQHMQPGDRIVGGFAGSRGISPNWESLCAYLTLAIIVPRADYLARLHPGSPAHLAEGLALISGPVLVSLGLQLLRLRRAPLFIAVTEQQVICYELTRLDSFPVRLKFCAPLPAVRLIRGRSGGLRWRSLVVSAAGTEGREMRLYVERKWRRDVAEALAAVEVGGGAVTEVGKNRFRRSAKMLTSAPSGLTPPELRQPGLVAGELALPESAHD
jgi:hypothetical protein